MARRPVPDWFQCSQAYQATTDKGTLSADARAVSTSGQRCEDYGQGSIHHGTDAPDGITLWPQSVRRNGGTVRRRMDRISFAFGRKAVMPRQLPVERRGYPAARGGCCGGGGRARPRFSRRGRPRGAGWLRCRGGLLVPFALHGGLDGGPDDPAVLVGQVPWVTLSTQRLLQLWCEGNGERDGLTSDGVSDVGILPAGTLDLELGPPDMGHATLLDVAVDRAACCAGEDVPDPGKAEEGDRDDEPEVGLSGRRQDGEDYDQGQQLGQQTEAGSGQRPDHGSVGVMVAPGAEIYVGPGGWADLADGAGISWFGPVHGDLRAGYRDVGGGG